LSEKEYEIVSVRVDDDRVGIVLSSDAGKGATDSFAVWLPADEYEAMPEEDFADLVSNAIDERMTSLEAYAARETANETKEKELAPAVKGKKYKRKKK